MLNLPQKLLHWILISVHFCLQGFNKFAMDKYFKSMRIDTNIFLNFRIWLKKKKEISVHVMHKKKCFIIMAVYKVMCTSLDARSDGFFLFGA